MFCIMDVSGSMDEGENHRQALLHAAVSVPDRTYEHIEVVFIRHHTVAKEVERGRLLPLPQIRRHRGIQRPGLMRTSSTSATPAAPGTSTARRPPTATTGRTIRPTAGSCSPVRSCPSSSTSPTSRSPRRAAEPVARVRTWPGGAQRQLRDAAIEGLPDIYPVFRELFKKKLA